MNIIAYFTLTADGFLPRAEDKDLLPPDLLIADSMKRAAKAGASRSIWRQNQGSVRAPEHLPASEEGPGDTFRHPFGQNQMAETASPALLPIDG